jgi:hypothetical protein
MKGITSILSASSVAFLLLLTSSAHAQSGRIAANIPFAFTVGGISLPAGRYEFANTGDRIVQVQNAERHTVLTLSVASIERRGLPKKSMLKFDTVGDRHILVQIWNDLADNGNEFLYGHSAMELLKHATESSEAANQSNTTAERIAKRAQ